MGQTGFQGVKQDDVNCGHFITVEMAYEPFHMAKGS